MISEIIMPDGYRVAVTNTDDVSDGYHTFGELYEHRCLLFAWFIDVCDPAYGYETFKTRKNSEGEEWEGWFIAGVNMADGQVTYHLPNTMWDLVHAPVIERNDKYDGHTSHDVVQRIRLILSGGHAE